MMTQNRVEKLTLNNQIVKMRKHVKRARLWLINQLNHRVKRLNGAHDGEQERNLRKAEKLRNEIQLLKHIDVDEVSKFALCNKQESPDQLTDQNGLDLGQKAMLKLANHKFVQEQVEIFRKDYAVPMDRLIILIRSLGLQYQKKKNKLLLNSTVAENPLKEIEKKIEKKTMLAKKIKTSEKEKHSPETKKTSQIAESSCGFLVQEDSKLTSNLVIQDKSEDKMIEQAFPVDALKIELHQISQPSLENCQTDVHNQVDHDQIATATPIVKKHAKRKEKVNKKIPWPKLSVSQINKTVGSMIIKQLNLEDEAGTISVGESHRIKLDSSQRSVEPFRDSFFLGGVDLPSEDGDEIKKNVSLRVDSGNTKSSQHKILLRASSNRPTGSFSNEHTQIKQAVSPAPETLHPSWQAKRKEKGLIINIGGCHGKKIRFDDD